MALRATRSLSPSLLLRVVVARTSNNNKETECSLKNKQTVHCVRMARLTAAMVVACIVFSFFSLCLASLLAPALLDLKDKVHSYTKDEHRAAVALAAG